jgi:phosphatidylinositol alpha-1,6-mannosyltransferase
MNVLFISRAYPPVLGGIEKHNFEIYQSLAKISHTILVANKKGKYFLPFFIPFALFKAVLLRKHYDVILLGDGVLSIVAFFVKIFSSKPVVCVVHGLDITYQNFIYRLFWRKCFFRKVDRFIAVGNETIFQAEKAGLSRDKFCFIPNGVNVERELEAYSSAEFYSLLACTPPGPVLLTLGRLVKRKGVVWFIDEVMPALDPSVTYVIAGAGPE